MKKRGEILAENLIFIILNLVFVVIIVLFLLKQGSGATILENTYSKQIALVLDSAKPNTLIKLNLEDLKEVSDKNKLDFKEVVKIDGNLVKVKLSEKGGQTYSFFNNVSVNCYPDREFYVFTISEKV
jgi:uncharacterized protein YpmS